MQILQNHVLPPDLEQSLRLALEYRNGGRLAEAERVYRQSFARYPHHPALLGHWGELNLLQGQADAALPLLEQARRGSPGTVQWWCLQAQGLLTLGRGKEAKKLLTEATGKGLRHPMIDALLEQARTGKKKSGKPVPLNVALQQMDALFRAGQYTEIDALGESMRLRYPKSASVWYMCGMAAMYLGHHPDALAWFERATQLDPGRAEGYLNLAQMLHLMQRDEDALKTLEKAIRLKPDFVDAYQDMGHSLQSLGRWEEAAKVYRKASELDPEDSVSFRGIGRSHFEVGRTHEAIEAYAIAAGLKPDDSTVLQEYARALKSALRYEEAAASLKRVVELAPKVGGVMDEYAGLLMEMGRYPEALEYYRCALALEPDGAFIINSNMLLNMNYDAHSSGCALMAEARAYGEKAERLVHLGEPFQNSLDPERRLRVGLMSCDLGQHPVTFFLLNMLAFIDAQQLELVAFETGVRTDTYNQRLRQYIPHWHQIADKKLTDEAIAKQIRAENIDILIDLNGHTGDNRLPVFSWKPAPVQVTWLGYLGTTGLKAMDYILADHHALPVGEEDQFTETPWRMPEAYICFSPPTAEVEVAPPPALETRHITFGCFNNLNKVNDRVVACWAGVLQRVPQSTLYLKSRSLGNEHMREKLVARFERHGVKAEQLLLEGLRGAHEEHFRDYHKIDIALDPFPYPGITTSVESLWMGVPVLTLAGDRFMGHQGETIMHNVGLPEWIAADEEDYVAKAAAFAGDIKALAALRSGLRERLLASPLCDAPRFARNFEQALRGMWRKWCETQKQAEETS